MKGRAGATGYLLGQCISTGISHLDGVLFTGLDEVALYPRDDAKKLADRFLRLKPKR